jgi:phosphatidate cytidylyltransferase
MLKLRILTAGVLAVLLAVGLFALPPRATVLAIGVVLTLGAWEWAAFGALRAVPARLAYAAALALLWFLAWRWTDSRGSLLILLSIACAWWSLAFLWLLLAPERHRASLALLAGVAVLVPAFVALARLEVARLEVSTPAVGTLGVGGFEIAHHDAVRGPQIVLWLILIVIAADIGAFFAGRRFGRRKLAPRVSPGKTWEGLCGGLLAVALVAAAAAFDLHLAPLPSVAFACAVGIFSVIGDLTESMFKRGAGLKDSGTILPGHGGVLDRIDSVTAAAPLYALGLFGAGVIR